MQPVLLGLSKQAVEMTSFKLEKFLCIWRLETGAYIAGTIGVVFGFLAVLGSVVYLAGWSDCEHTHHLICNSSKLRKPFLSYLISFEVEENFASRNRYEFNYRIIADVYCFCYVVGRGKSGSLKSDFNEMTITINLFVTAKSLESYAFHHILRILRSNKRSSFISFEHTISSGNHPYNHRGLLLPFWFFPLQFV